MKDKLFNELVESVREGGAILRGEAVPGRAFKFDGHKAKHIQAEACDDKPSENSFLASENS